MKTRNMVVEYQNLIFQPPVPKDSLFQQACSNDETTITHWLDTWIANIKSNHESHGPFSENGLGQLFGQYRHRPVIVAGSGPSLKYNADELKNRNGIPLVSCLHNFHFFEDRGVEPEYYVTLDAGDVTVEEVSEGGLKDESFYWDLTKNRSLIAFIGTSPKLIEKWQGKIYWFNAPVPGDEYIKRVDEIEKFHTLVSNGGNVLGGCLYISKGFFGAGSIIFTGADFSFGYDRKFHGWDSKYDQNMGNCVPLVDVFGNKIPTWQSYANFKGWFDWVALHVPGIYINCSEGGCLGSYPDGNLNSFKYMDLKDCIAMYSMCDNLKEQSVNPKVEGPDGMKILF